MNSVEVVYKSGIRHGYARAQRDGKILVTIPSRLRGRQDFYDALMEKAALLQKKLATKTVWQPIRGSRICLFGDYVERASITGNEDVYLKKLLLDYVTPLCDLYAARLHMTYRTITVKKLRAKWGSCSSRQELVFNRDLVHLPLVVVKYVVVHEIAHLVHKHHQKSFWQEVAVLMPDYKVHEKFLKNIRMYAVG